MNEKEYIVVRNLSNIEISIKAVREILPNLDGIVKEGDLSKILYILSGWQEKLYKEINTDA